MKQLQEKMKTLNNLFKSYLLPVVIFAFAIPSWAQKDTAEVVKKKPFLSLKYFNIQNEIHYLVFQGMLKSKTNLEPLAKRNLTVFLNDETEASNKIGSFVTDFEGRANIQIPVAFADAWKQSNQHKFIAILDSVDEMGVLQTETEITKFKLLLDTLNEEDVRKIKISCLELTDTLWTPVADVEVRVGIKRLSSILPVGEEATATTDSSGTAIVDFTIDSIPGDAQGMIFIAAKIEDNDVYGNLSYEMKVPWGNASSYTNPYGKRSLWATGDKVPMWLLTLACGIIFSVWGTLIYLVLQLFKVRKLGLKA
ncbi:MAG: hypothetical protein JNK69_04825 [Saprospiraceae bacterium]|nr:hypothetical protein [Candidatus Vicinibacter proximus]MBL7822710.1 hypothetical protein [Saprospiraceae bacterium]HRG33209.1 hypothetical protein [Saprospiraceae bacterium]